MKDRNLLRGLFVVAFSLVFGLQALRYPLGHFVEAGPGLFPLIISSFLLTIGIAIVVRSRYNVRAPLEGQLRNIALIVASLGGFALLSKFVNMTAAIAFMVFCASFAVTPYSIPRSLKIAVALIAVAFVFKQFLGLSLPLF